jgi:hypothetical protein
MLEVINDHRHRHINEPTISFTPIKSEAYSMVSVSNWPFVLMLVATRTTHFANAESEYSLSSDSKWQPIKPSEVARMYNNSFMSDTKFTFGTNKLGEVFYAHKYVLAFSSPLFYEMFYSNNIEKPIKAIHLSNHNNETIAGFFGFIYSMHTNTCWLLAARCFTRCFTAII